MKIAARRPSLFGAVGLIGLGLSLAACDQSRLTAPTPLSTQAALSVSGGGANAASYIGDATAVRATVLGLTTELVHAGPLPSAGGADDATLVTASIGGILGAQILHAATAGAGDRAASDASVAGLGVHVGILSLGASLVRASATASCAGGSVSTSGASQIVGLVINGKSITVTGRPNQTVYLPLGLGRVVINEQISSSGEITVNALHVILLGVANIVVSQAHAGVTCGGPDICTDDDFVTGSGFVFGTPTGTRADLAVMAGIDGGALFFGHLVFDDRDPGGPHVVGTSMTRYFFVDASTRRIEGTATVNGVGGFTFVVEITDNGDPGSADVFTITLSNGYTASGVLAGGNFQLISDLCPVET